MEKAYYQEPQYKLHCLLELAENYLELVNAIQLTGA